MLVFISGCLIGQHSPVELTTFSKMLIHSTNTRMRRDASLVNTHIVSCFIGQHNPVGGSGREGLRERVYGAAKRGARRRAGRRDRLRRAQEGFPLGR